MLYQGSIDTLGQESLSRSNEATVSEQPITSLPTPPSALDYDEAATWVTQFLSSCEVELATETLDTYRRKLSRFLSWWAGLAPRPLCTAQLAFRYARHLEDQAGSSRSHNLHFAVLRRWGWYLVTQGRLETNPWQRVVPPRQPVQLSTDWLVFREIKQLLQSFDCEKLSQHRDAVLCRLMLKTGARETELARARLKDLRPIGPDGTEAWLTLQSKGKQTEEPVLLVASLKQDLDDYLRRRYPSGAYPPDAPLFTTYTDDDERPMPPREMRRRITAALRRAGIKRPGITPLSLRQTAGKQALAKKAPPVAVQEMLRHEHLRTTKRLIDQEHRRATAAERFLSHY